MVRSCWGPGSPRKRSVLPVSGVAAGRGSPSPSEPTDQRADSVTAPSLAECPSARALATKLHISRPTTAKRRRRLLQHGLEGLTNGHRGCAPACWPSRARRHRKSRRTARTAASPPTPRGQGHRIPHLAGNGPPAAQVGAPQGPNDPDFETKAADIICLYLDPPRHATAFCIDERAAIQALDRRDQVLPLSPGRVERQRNVLARAIFTSTALPAPKLRRYTDAYSKRARPSR